MDFHQLRVFVEVAKQKNFSRAAANIFLSQPTVSAHIKTLENEIGSPLFDRSQRELMLTEGGKILFKFAQEILEIKEKAFAAIQENYRITKGHLEIAASSVPGAYLLPGLLHSFNKKHPGVTFSVLLRDSRHVFENIRDYTYDLGFAGKPVRIEGLGQVKLVEDQLILITPPGQILPERPVQYPVSLRLSRKLVSAIPLSYGNRDRQRALFLKRPCKNGSAALPGFGWQLTWKARKPLKKPLKQALGSR